jgi:hypothetical protein
MIVSVGRSPLRVLSFALMSVPMLLLAVDMTFSYRLFPAPDTTDVVVGQTTDAAGNTVQITDEVLTKEGRAQRRRDLAWSSVLFLGGAATAFFSMRELIAPRRVLTADQRGLYLRIFGSRTPPVRLGWAEIEAVRSGVLDVDGDDVEVLSILPVDPVLLPERPSGAVVDPPWLHLIADDWDRPPHRVVPVIEGWITGFGRADQYE